MSNIPSFSKLLEIYYEIKENSVEQWTPVVVRNSREVCQIKAFENRITVYFYFPTKKYGVSATKR